MDELAAVDASVGFSIGIEELLQSIASPHVSVRVVADGLHLGGREGIESSSRPTGSETS